MTFNERLADVSVTDAHPATDAERTEAGQRPSGQDYFDAMTKEQQDATFGPDIAAALRSGKLQLTDLTTTKDGFLVRKPIDTLLP